MKYRMVTKPDEATIADWVSKDPDHAGRVNAAFFSNEDLPRAECLVVEDDLGPVLYVVAENVLRLHLQSAPAKTRAEKLRVARALDEFAEKIKHQAAPKYKQIIFESVVEPLINFLHKRGYRSSPAEQVLNLEKPKTYAIRRTTRNWMDEKG